MFCPDGKGGESTLWNRLVLEMETAIGGAKVQEETDYRCAEARWMRSGCGCCLQNTNVNGNVPTVSNVNHGSPMTTYGSRPIRSSLTRSLLLSVCCLSKRHCLSRLPSVADHVPSLP